MCVMVVGDLHGDWRVLNELIARKKPDNILQCGDFGWWPGLEVRRPVLYRDQHRWVLRGVKTQNSKVYWCDGNHEDHSVLLQNGCVQQMYENVYFGARGSTITLPDGRVVLFAGGASSTDICFRTPGYDWFPGENISYSDVDRMLGYGRVDIVVSHTCPVSFPIGGTVEKSRDSNRLVLEDVLIKYRPELWLFGHWHTALSGVCGNTKWHCLDYPKHSGRWWMWI